MTRPPSAPADSGDSGLGRVYVAVIVLEALVIGGLYWFGRHFG